jgi:ABC-type transport system involved in multi-copper enzyme maturation permease subunit
LQLIKIPYLKKIFHDQKIIILLLILFSVLFEYLYAWLLFESQISQIVESYMQLLPSEFTTIMGIDAGATYFGIQALAFGYAHPIILVSLFFLPISLPSRYLAGEIEQKTFDILLSYPIYRFVIPIHIFLFITIALLLQIAAMFIGTWIAYLKFELNINIFDYVRAALTGYFFYLSSTALALAISSFHNERGKSLSRIIGLIVFLYFCDTIFKINKSLEPFLAFSYFQLYQPGKLVLNQINTGNCILVSLLLTIFFFSVALWQFTRRDL